MNYSNEELAILIRKGENKYCSQLWTQLKNLLYAYAYKIAKRYPQLMQSNSLTVDDLLQECYFIMLDVVNAYDANKRYKLNTYIKYQAINHFNSLLKVKGSKDILNICSSLDEAVDEDNENSLIDIIADDTAEQAYYNIDNDLYIEQLRTDLEKAFIEVLNEEQSKYIKLRYYCNMNSKDIAQCCNTSYGAVRNQLDIAYRKLKRCSRLAPYRAADIVNIYKGNGLQSFKNRGCSRVENAIEITERINNNHHEEGGAVRVD